MTNLSVLFAVGFFLLVGLGASTATAKEHQNDKSGKSGSTTSSAKDFLVQGLEEVEPAFGAFKGQMYAGRIPVDHSATRSDRGEFQFWLFAPDHPQVEESMMIWFNGGPGCSSLGAGVLFEHSPVSVQPHRAGYCCSSAHPPLQVNNFSWTKATYMLYVEQPAHTGFSTGIVPQTEADVARDMVDWLTNFYRVFSDLVTCDLFIFGESYAGMYVPAVALGIHHENKRRKKNNKSSAPDDDDNGEQFDELPLIPLKGIGVGNGLMDVKTQGPAVIDYAYWHGMIDMATRDYLKGQWDRCYQSALANDGLEQPKPLHSFTTGDECGFLDAVLISAGDQLLPHGLGPNMYEITTWDPYPIFDGTNRTTIHAFYNNPKVQEILHAPVGATWNDCQVEDDEPNQRRRRLKMLDYDRPLSQLPSIAELMDDGNVEVLIYNGDLDISVCAQGSEAALNRMHWSHAEEWYNANRSLWIVGNTQEEEDPLSPFVAGYVKEVDRLHFLILRNSGHMVPYNVPRNGLDMVTRFLSGTSLSDVPLPNYPVQYGSPAEIKEEEKEFRDGMSYHHVAKGGSMLRINILVATSAFLGGIAASNCARRKGYQQLPQA